MRWWHRFVHFTYTGVTQDHMGLTVSVYEACICGKEWRS